MTLAQGRAEASERRALRGIEWKGLPRPEVAAEALVCIPLVARQLAVSETMRTILLQLILQKIVLPGDPAMTKRRRCQSRNGIAPSCDNFM